MVGLVFDLVVYEKIKTPDSLVSVDVAELDEVVISLRGFETCLSNVQV